MTSDPWDAEWCGDELDEQMLYGDGQGGTDPPPECFNCNCSDVPLPEECPFEEEFFEHMKASIRLTYWRKHYDKALKSRRNAVAIMN